MEGTSVAEPSPDRSEAQAVMMRRKEYRERWFAVLRDGQAPMKVRWTRPLSEFVFRAATRRCGLVLAMAATHCCLQPLLMARTTERALARPARPAQCLLEIKGVHYVGDRCLFAPIDHVGSFTITTPEGIGARVEVRAPEKADVFWSKGAGKTAANPLGSAYSDGEGCWIVDPSLDPAKRTLVCAWGDSQKLFLGPTPVDAPTSLAWGERAGMSAQILSSSGLGTEDAKITAVKSQDGAVNWCRESYDYSIKCIDDTMGDTGLAPGKVNLQANCKTRRFTDYWGESSEIFRRRHSELENE